MKIFIFAQFYILNIILISIEHFIFQQKETELKAT